MRLSQRSQPGSAGWRPGVFTCQLAAGGVDLLPPSLTELERRLQGRGGLDPEELARRLTNGRAELKEAHWYDYLVINDDKATALSQLQAIVAAARCRTPQLWPQLAPRYLNNNP